MKTISDFLNIYSNISEKKITQQEFIDIFPKFALIINYFSLDVIEMIELVDTLVEFKNCHQIAKINEKTVILLKKTTNNKFYNLEKTLYISRLLKHLLLPFNINKCKEEYDTFLHISTFETLLDLIVNVFNKEDYNLLQTYNYELSEISLQYKKNRELYKKKINDEIILYTLMSHIYAIYYFNQEQYGNDYSNLNLLINNTIDNYQQLINYCYAEGISDNFKKIILEKKEIYKEYEVCRKIIDYFFDDKNKEKRKC